MIKTHSNNGMRLLFYVMKEIKSLPFCLYCGNRLTKHKSILFTYFCSHCDYECLLNNPFCNHCSHPMFVSASIGELCSNPNCHLISLHKVKKNIYMISYNNYVIITFDYIDNQISHYYLGNNIYSISEFNNKRITNFIKSVYKRLSISQNI